MIESTRRARIFLAVVILIGLSAQRSALVFGASLKAEKKKELDRVVSELNRKRAEIDKYRKEERSLERDLLKLEDKRDRSRDKLRNLKRDLGAAQGRIGELRQKVEALQTAFGGWSDLLAEGLRAFDARQRVDTAFFGADELWGQVFLRASLMGQARYLEGLQGMRVSAERAAEDLRRREKQLENRSRQESAEARRQDSLLREKRTSLQETQTLREQALERMRALQESAEALNQLLQSLDRRALRLRRTQRPPIARHSLPWPVDGRTVGAFGKEKVKGLDTWVIRSGIQIEAANGAAVRAVGSGRVAYAGPFRRYGRIVIVDHGSGFFSIYGFLDRIVSSKGDDVEAKDLLGYAGPSEDATAEAAPGRSVVYFEVRQNGMALDPAGWMEKR